MTPETTDLDVRWLEPPEPFERIAAALESLTPGGRLRVMIHREPRPLFSWLVEEGFAYEHGYKPEGYFEILITKP
ncbi:MAG: DUF2249 domain-containing protein [Burkholderiales bacterium]